MTKKEMQDKIKELESRIEQLEARPAYVPQPYPVPSYPPGPWWGIYPPFDPTGYEMIWTDNTTATIR